MFCIFQFSLKLKILGLPRPACVKPQDVVQQLSRTNAKNKSSKMEIEIFNNSTKEQQNKFLEAIMESENNISDYRIDLKLHDWTAWQIDKAKLES